MPRANDTSPSTSEYTVTVCEFCGKPKPCAWVILNDICECAEEGNGRD